ncbi:hypothetical protein J3459_012381 [Metarhizium acridum]|nr:hypothetical protein J3459_012381 [Metarhizium acridum]
MPKQFRYGMIICCWAFYGAHGNYRVLGFPVVFTFSFTNKELQTDPLTTLRERFEQLDVKLLTDYNIEHTTHVVSRKRNTAKGLQALINGKYVVTETFLEAITQAAEANDASEASSLEQDFDTYWPTAMEHLPPRGGEPVQHPDSIYAPDRDRQDVFEGYTFIFYDKTQYSNLMAPITNGGGKAIFESITPGETHTDEFSRLLCLETPHQAAAEEQDEGGLFVSQEPDIVGSQPLTGIYDSQARKRRASIEVDLMDGMAPAVARFKRQRLERGEDFAPPSPSPEPEPATVTAKKRKEKLDVLAMAARHREEEEARARAEREDLANLPDDIDLAEIRRLNIVEEMEIRAPARDIRTREKDVVDGRWNPKWNGMKNFKKFRSRGEATGRLPVRTIVALQEVKNKEFGIGDNYWLEDECVERRRSLNKVRSAQSTQSSASAAEPSSRHRATHVVVSESEEENNASDSVRTGKQAGPVGTSSTKITATPSQTTSTSSSRQARATQEKRSARRSLVGGEPKGPGQLYELSS